MWYGITGYALNGLYLLTRWWADGQTEGSSTITLTQEERERIREQARRDQARRGDREPQ